jgi:galactose-1-phosphate uridylyltransferase
MKKYIVSIVTVLAAGLFITGCGQSTPKGTDSEVKETVIQVAKKEMIRRNLIELFGVERTMEQARTRAKKDKWLKPFLDEIEDTTYAIENIRVNSIDDKIKKSTSSADLMIIQKGKSKKVPITFTAQLNNDGETYVEVFLK